MSAQENAECGLHEVRGRVLPVTTRNRFGWEGREFVIDGPLLVHGDADDLDVRSNPVKSTRLQQAARLLVGFNVNRKPKWTMKDLIRVVLRNYRTGATFLATRGVWIDSETRKRDSERGGQIIIVDFNHLPPKRFENDMVRLAEKIAKSLRQEEILVEIQLGGQATKVLQVVP